MEGVKNGHNYQLTVDPLEILEAKSMPATPPSILTVIKPEIILEY